MLRVEHLSKIYGDGTPALRDVSVTIHDGEFVAVIGPSGAGKSTFLRCINRLIEPSAGQIWLDGTEITAASPDVLRSIRRDVGMIMTPFVGSGRGAFAAGRSPRLLLADTYLAAADPATAQALLQYLARLNREEGITIICNLHTPPLARHYAGRVLLFTNPGSGGEIAYDGPPDRLAEILPRALSGADLSQIEPR